MSESTVCSSPVCTEPGPVTVEVTIGWTKSDRSIGYSSFDGYRPGAKQHTETIRVEFSEQEMKDYGNEPFENYVAEWVFEATNNPSAHGNRIAYRFQQAIEATGYRGEGAHYSLSVGDTVTVGGVMVACDRWGWKKVSA
jgi:hypothetical protein